MAKQFDFKPVVKDKLVRELDKRNLSQKEACDAMGRSPNYLCDCMRRGMVPAATAVMLKTLFNISPEDYAPDAKPEPVPETPAFDYDRLYNVVYHAVLNGIKKGLE